MALTASERSRTQCPVIRCTGLPPVPDARQRMLQNMDVTPVEQVCLTRSAGRVLAADIIRFQARSRHFAIPQPWMVTPSVPADVARMPRRSPWTSWACRRRASGLTAERTPVRKRLCGSSPARLCRRVRIRSSFRRTSGGSSSDGPVVVTGSAEARAASSGLRGLDFHEGETLCSRSGMMLNTPRIDGTGGCRLDYAERSQCAAGHRSHLLSTGDELVQPGTPVRPGPDRLLQRVWCRPPWCEQAGGSATTARRCARRP
jgi:hypothetical protein